MEKGHQIALWKDVDGESIEERIQYTKEMLDEMTKRDEYKDLDLSEFRIELIFRNHEGTQKPSAALKLTKK